MDEVVQVLEWRDVEFEGLGATAGPGTTSGRPGVLLPFERQKTIHDKHWQKWRKDPENKEKLEVVAKRREGRKNRSTETARRCIAQVASRRWEGRIGCTS